MSRVSKLEELIRQHKILYYQGKPEISDNDYDALEEELKKLSPDSPVLKMVGTSSISGNKVKHDSKMLSLNKVYEVDELLKWSEGREIVSTYKIDGVSCSLVYDNGILEMAKTRGDGSVGENITEKSMWINAIPKKIKLKNKCEIRGEMLCPEGDFFELSNVMSSLGLERPTSQRNIVAGLISRKENIDLCRFITFTAFELILDSSEIKTEKEKVGKLKDLGFNVPLTQLHQEKNSIEKVIEDAKDFISNGDYQIDGLVFSFNDLVLHNSLGETAHHPRYKMAFKFRSESKATIIKDIEWSVSRNGVLTPIALVQPVRLGGAEISRVTLHNYGMLKQHNLKKNDTIEIIRSGEVIPKFLSVVKESKGDISIPNKCPECNSKVKKQEIRLFCSNKSCPTRVRESILNFVHKIGMDDISTKRLDEMLKSKLITSVTDLYKLKKEDFLTLDKVKDKLANKFVATIEASKKTDLVTFLSALGIQGGAYNKCEKIVFSGIDTLEKIKKLTPEKLEQVESFAKKSAQEFLNSLEEKMPLIDDLMRHKFIFEQKKINSSPITHKKVCITGALSMKRSVIEQKIRDCGGVAVSSVSQNTDFLVTNDTTSGSSKFKKAKELGVAIISEKELLAMLPKD